MMNIDERDDTNDSSLGAPGEEPRATMVPPTSLSTYVSILTTYLFFSKRLVTK